MGGAVRDRKPPFRKPKTGKIAVKVINHYEDEVLQAEKMSPRCGARWRRV